MIALVVPYWRATRVALANHISAALEVTALILFIVLLLLLLLLKCAFMASVVFL